MVQSSRNTTHDGPPADRGADEETGSLYFFPDEEVSEERVQAILRDGAGDEKAWVVSHLLRYAQWDDIWGYVSRDEVREIFPHLDLPEKLRAAWARMLKIDVPV